MSRGSFKFWETHRLRHQLFKLCVCNGAVSIPKNFAWIRSTDMHAVEIPLTNAETEWNAV